MSNTKFLEKFLSIFHEDWMSDRDIESFNAIARGLYGPDIEQLIKEALKLGLTDEELDTTLELVKRLGKSLEATSTVKRICENVQARDDGCFTNEMGSRSTLDPVSYDGSFIS